MFCYLFLVAAMILGLIIRYHDAIAAYFRILDGGKSFNDHHNGASKQAKLDQLPVEKKR